MRGNTSVPLTLTLLFLRTMEAKRKRQAGLNRWLALNRAEARLKYHARRAGYYNFWQYKGKAYWEWRQRDKKWMEWRQNNSFRQDRGVNYFNSYTPKWNYTKHRWEWLPHPIWIKNDDVKNQKRLNKYDIY